MGMGMGMETSMGMEIKRGKKNRNGSGILWGSCMNECMYECNIPISVLGLHYLLVSKLQLID